VRAFPSVTPASQDRASIISDPCLLDRSQSLAVICKLRLVCTSETEVCPKRLGSHCRCWTVCERRFWARPTSRAQSHAAPHALPDRWLRRAINKQWLSCNHQMVIDRTDWPVYSVDSPAPTSCSPSAPHLLHNLKRHYLMPSPEPSVSRSIEYAWLVPRACQYTCGGR